jgi:short subunit dehydrogenase-like uncharacterized protein
MLDKGSKTRILLYGAYGYPGRLAAELAAARKLNVVLAGRNKDALAELGTGACGSKNHELFVAQRHHWVHAHGAACGNEAGEERHSAE